MSKSLGNTVAAVGRDRPLRRRRAALVLLHLQAAVGRLPLLAGDDRRGASGSSCCSCGTRTGSTCCTPTPTSSRPSRSTTSSRSSSTAGRCRGCRRRSRSCASAWTSSTRPSPAARSRRSSTSSPTGTCAVRAARFWDGDPAAFATLRECLLTVAKLLAPFCPFIADEIYDNLDGSEPSVHLCDFPVAGERDRELEQAMDVARETVRLGLAARGQAKLKVRQPLHERGGRGHRLRARRRSSAWRSVDPRRAQRPRAAVRVRGRRARRRSRSSPTTARSGPRFGKQMPLVAAAVAGLDAAHAAARAARRRARWRSRSAARTTS